ATRLGDMSMTNNYNAPSTQIAPSQTKYFVNA
ncbi:type VI secretion protein, partial [Yersinia pestis]